MHPDVSVVIPTCNRQRYLEHAVTCCLEGNEGIEVEVVVVDDGSTDGTREYLESVKDQRVRAIFQAHQGAQVARNTGQEAARGRAVKHIDDDDYVLPGALETQYRVLQREGVDVCYGDYYYRDDREDTDADRYFENGEAPDFFTALLSKSINRLQLAMLFRAEAIQSVKWDESLDYQQDVDFMLRAASRGLSSVHLSEPVAVHRLHEGDRITDVRQREEVSRRLDQQCRWCWRALKNLREHAGNVAEEQRRAAATGLWREAHKLAPYDWQKAVYWLRKVRKIEPHFRPERDHAVLSVLDSLFPPLVTERLANPLRRLRT